MHTRLFPILWSTACLWFMAGCGPGPEASASSNKAQPSQDAKAASSGPAFSLVKGGTAQAVVVLASDATPRNREAAEELVNAVKEISGATLKIVEATPDNAPERAVWIGMQPGIEALFPGVDLSLTKPEEIRIVTSENHLLIAGRDIFDPENQTLVGGGHKVEGVQREYGTANAVYTFLQDQLGVRWLLPGELGQDFPQSTDITIAPTDTCYAPQFRLRMGIFYGFDLGKMNYGDDTSTWARHQRMLLDSLDAEAGHPFTDWWEKYGATRPELFALMPDGTRGTYPPEPKWKKRCDGEPAVAEVWLENVAEQRKNNPNGTIFSVAANDGSSSGICLDPRSLAMDPPLGPDVPVFSISYGSSGGTRQLPRLSDRYVKVANNLARKLKERYPGEELYVTQTSYGLVGRQAPTTVVPDDNVIILAVHNFLLRGDADRAVERKNLADWSKISDKIIWRPNTGGGAGWWWALPDVPFAQVADDFRFAADHNVIGITIDTVWQHWATTGPLYYLMAQLAWNPRADYKEIFEDFCRRSYGPASDTMQEYWLLMEKTRNDLTAASPSRWRAMDSPKFYTDEFFAKAYGLLDRAKEQVKGAPEKFAKRVEFVRYGLDYTKHTIGVRKAMERYDASKNTDEAALAEVLAGWAKTEEFRKTFPEHAIAWVRVFRNDPSAKKQRQKRMFGLHPDTALNAKFLKEWRDADSKSGSDGLE